MASFDAHKREGDTLSFRITNFKSFTTLCVTLGDNEAIFFLGANAEAEILNAFKGVEVRQ